MIAFQGRSIEAIEDKVESCYTNSYVTSYWEGDGVRFDFTGTNDFDEYLSEAEDHTYYNAEPDEEVIKAHFSEVTLFDLSDYVGYERHNKSGIGLASIILCFYVAFFTVIILAVELVVALILKLTVFRVKKEKIAG